ncbi:lysozyme inhibitor LprI family protein [Shewanella sp. 0m-4]
MKKNTILGYSLLILFSVTALANEIDCDSAYSTIEINQCAAQELDTANIEMQTYLAKAYEHNSYDAELISAIKAAQLDWQQYLTSHCDAVYTQWREGTIRGVMAISCQTKLTKLRTHEIWDNYLTYRDSTPAVLPEPKS